MKPVLWWTIAGAAIPAALLTLTFIPVALGGGADDFLASIGALLLALIMIVPPGAIGGAVIGFIDLALSRYVAHGTAASKRTRALIAALGLFVLLTALAMLLLRFTATDMTHVAFNMAASAAVAAVPTVIAYVRFSRLPIRTQPGPHERSAPNLRE